MNYSQLMNKLNYHFTDDQCRRMWACIELYRPTLWNTQFETNGISRIHIDKKQIKILNKSKHISEEINKLRKTNNIKHLTNCNCNTLQANDFKCDEQLKIEIEEIEDYIRNKTERYK